MPYRSQGCGFLFVVWASDEKIYKTPRLLRYLMQDRHSTEGHDSKLFAQWSSFPEHKSRKNGYFGIGDFLEGGASMLQNCVPLDALRPGQHGTVAQLRLQGALLQRLLDLGLTEDCPISCRLRAPAGDPAAFGIRGAVIALRSADAAGILVRLEGTPWPDETARRISPSP